jgi:predicted nucleic acid-binding protein
LSRFLADSNCLIAVMCGWHEHHQATIESLDRRADGGEELIVAAHSLLEVYAVLTRLPEPHALAPDVAGDLVRANWGRVRTIALTASDVHALIRRDAEGGVGGGRTYDSVIAASAIKGDASAILTWNVRNFAPWADRIEVVSPAPR